MRDFKGMKRQRSRNRNGGGGNGGGGGGGGKPQQNANRAFDSNGPEGVKVRGAAQHVYEKYQQLARDATTLGDRVLAENYLQHAEHYFRMMRAMQPLRPVSEILGRDQFVSGFDIDFEDESGGAIEAAENESESEEVPVEMVETGSDRGYANQPRRDDYRRDDRQGDQRPNDQRSTDQRQGDQRPNDQRQGEWRSRDGGNARQDRTGGERSQNERTQGERNPNDRFVERPRNGRDERPRYSRDDRAPRVDEDPLSVVEPQATPLTTAAGMTTPVLRADDGDISHAPAFLQARPVEPKADTSEDRRPRRRRAPAAAAPVSSDDEN